MENRELTLISSDIFLKEITENNGEEAIENVNEEMEVLNRNERFEDQLYELLVPCIGIKFNSINEAYIFL